MSNQRSENDQRSELGHTDGYFAYYATLRIFGNISDFDEISSRMGLSPSEVIRKGPRATGSLVYPHDMWQYKPPVDKFHHLEEHINALWAAIKGSKDYLIELKKTQTVDVYLGYSPDSWTTSLVLSHTCLTMFIELKIPFSLSIIVV